MSASSMLLGDDIAQSNILRSGGEITAVVVATVDPLALVLRPESDSLPRFSAVRC